MSEGRAAAGEVQAANTLGSQLRRLLGAFLEARAAQGLSTNTVALNERTLKVFIAWLERDKADISSLVAVDRRVLEDYAVHLAVVETEEGRRLKAASRLIYLVALRALFRWLEAEGKVLRNPAEDLRLPKVPRPLPRGVLTVEEVEWVLRVPDLATPLGLRDRAILELLYASAIRNAELRALELDALDFAEELVTVRHGKGGRYRTVPMGTEGARYLKRYLAEGRPKLRAAPGERRVFLTVEGRGLSESQLAKRMQAIGRAAGLEKPLTCHGLRHSCATHLLRNRADLRHIQELLGHRSLVSTQIYTHVAAADLKRVHERCHPRERRR